MACISNIERVVSYVQETSLGATPASPSMLPLRYTDGFINPAVETSNSNEIQSDGQLRDVHYLAESTEGSFNVEASYGSHDDWIEAAFGGTWATNVLKLGMVKRFFTIEEANVADNVFLKNAGQVVNSFSLSMAVNQPITGSFNLLGQKQTSEGATLGTPAAKLTHKAFKSFSGALSEGGSASAIITALDINVEQNYSPVYASGNGGAIRCFSKEQTAITGTLTAVFDSHLLLLKFLNKTTSSLSTTLLGATGGDHTYLFPKIHYTGANRSVGDGQTLLIGLPFTAVFDATEATALKLTRTPT